MSGFHFDDYAIFSDRVLTSPSGWTAVWALRQTRPLTYLTFWLNWMAGGSDPLGYHVFNLALHLGAVLLAYECLRRLLAERAALAAAAIFAVHPIAGRGGGLRVGRAAIVLAALLSLASLAAWLDGKRWLAVAWFAAALLAKEECAAFPLALLLLERSGPPRPRRRRSAEPRCRFPRWFCWRWRRGRAWSGPRPRRPAHPPAVRPPSRPGSTSWRKAR